MEFDKKILRKLQETARTTSSATYEARVEAENRISHARRRGYRKEPTGRIEQINFRGRADLKGEIEREATALDILKAELLERMWEAYLAQKHTAE